MPEIVHAVVSVLFLYTTMELALSAVKDVSVLRRMIFATTYLPQELPQYWDIIAFFSCTGSRSQIGSDTVKLLIENLQVLNRQAFASDADLTRELLTMPVEMSKEPLGVVLISEKQTCRKCGGKLLLRRDRPCRLILYTETMGTVTASHYHKFCQNQRRYFVA